MVLTKQGRILAVGDLHGRYDLLKQLVEESIRFDPSLDVMVFLGDYIDFRPFGLGRYDREAINSAKVVQYLSEMRARFPERIILLKGNHEVMAEWYFEHKMAFDLDTWETNGGAETIESFGGLKNAEEVLLPFIKSLKLYYRTPEADFVHANVPRGKTLETATEDELLWDRGDYSGEKVLLAGHTIHPNVFLEHGGKKIMIDTGAFLTGKLTAFDVKTGEIYEAV